MERCQTGINDAMDDEYMAVQLSSYTKNIESARDLQSQLDHLAANGVVSLDDLGKAAQNLAMHFRTNNTAIMSWSKVLQILPRPERFPQSSFPIHGRR